MIPTRKCLLVDIFSLADYQNHALILSPDTMLMHRAAIVHAQYTVNAPELPPCVCFCFLFLIHVCFVNNF